MITQALWAVLVAGFGTQLVKMLLIFFKHHRVSWHDLIVTGGMPSSHSAFVISLVTAVYIEEGVTTLFVFSLVFALIVIRDAFGVRRSVGEEGKQIEKLLRRHKMKSKFHYSLGHTPAQVLVGALCGFVITVLFYLV